MELPNKYRLLGLDNSRYCTGWCVIDVENTNMKLIDYGFLNTKSIKDEGDTLVFIEKSLNNIIKQYNPNYIAAEQMFVGKNSETAMVLSHIHGVMLLTAKKLNISVQYYAVMTMKSCVLGGIKTKKEDGTKKTGDEMKKEVADKIIEIFGINNFIKPFTNDVTDAISAAVTFVLKHKDNNNTINLKGKKNKKNTKNTKGNKNEKS